MLEIQIQILWKILTVSLCNIGLVKLTDILSRCNHVHDVEVPEKVENVEEKEIFDAFRKQLAENKPKKGKGKKGGKKKKKKAWTIKRLDWKLKATFRKILHTILKTSSRQHLIINKGLKLVAMHLISRLSQSYCQRQSCAAAWEPAN